MDSLQDILANKEISPPDEMALIKSYIQRNYRSRASVKLTRGAIIVSVPNAALAATLQLERQKMIAACNLGDKKLVIRNRN